MLATETIRNFAELVWVPELAQAEPGLHWSDAGERALEISRKAGRRDISVRLDIDHRGDVIRASSSLRPNDAPDGYASSSRCLLVSDADGLFTERFRSNTAPPRGVTGNVGSITVTQKACTIASEAR